MAFSFDYSTHSQWRIYFQSRVAHIFHKDLVLMIGESDRCVKPSSVHHLIVWAHNVAEPTLTN